MSNSVEEVSSPDLRYPIGRFQWPAQVAQAAREESIRMLEQFPRTLAHEVSTFSDEQLDTPYRPDGWTVRQLVHHIADSHINSYVRFRLALTEDNPPVRGYDEKSWAELPDCKSALIGPSLAILAGIHERWTYVMKQMTDAQWSRTFNHSERGPMRLDTTLALYAWHGEHHLAHIRALRKRENW